MRWLDSWVAAYVTPAASARPVRPTAIQASSERVCIDTTLALLWQRPGQGRQAQHRVCAGVAVYPIRERHLARPAAHERPRDRQSEAGPARRAPPGAAAVK